MIISTFQHITQFYLIFRYHHIGVLLSAPWFDSKRSSILL